MYLFQKQSYELKTDYNNLVSDFNIQRPPYVVYDTETTGLDVLEDKPFLISIGFNKTVYVFEVNEDSLKAFHEVAKNTKMLIAHNAKYDFHMMYNVGVNLEGCNIGDSLTIARLTQYADSIDSISLESLGAKYVDKDSKFAGKVIKKQLNDINKIRRKELRTYIKDNYNKDYRAIIDSYDKRVQYVPTKWDVVFSELDAVYKKPTYYDSYLEEPQLMTHYAADDVVILLEYLKKALPILKEVDPDLKTFNREGKLISAVANMERVGLRADIQYLLDSRDRVIEYRDKLYLKAHAIAGVTFTASQHKLIKEIFKTKFEVALESSDMKSLKDVANMKIDGASDLANIIIDLRTVDKWLSTYIEGMLNRVKNNRVYTSINNSGAVSGRVSSDMQQQPKDPLYDDEGVELFHPRRVFINDDGFKTYYFDYSQMELRLQAQYTIWVSGGDKNLCRAYMPYDCTSFLTGEKFDYETPEGVSQWGTGEWLDENDEPWTPTDLHSVTTHKAFPDVNIDSAEFKKLRKLGKVANFLKNYGGGVEAIIEQLGVSRDIAIALDQGYYQAFPVIKDYQNWVNKKLYQNGYIHNIYGRRYYMDNSKWFYKAINYVIQGGCADMVKQKEIEIYEFIKEHNLQSKMLLPVHDEVQVMVAEDEEWIVPEIKKIMQDVADVMPNVPMICDVERTDTNWAEKYEVE